MKTNKGLTEKAEIHAYIHELGRDMDTKLKVWEAAKSLYVSATTHYGEMLAEELVGLTVGDRILHKGQEFKILHFSTWVSKDGELGLAAECDHLNEQGEPSLFSPTSRIKIEIDASDAPAEGE